jgi:hypothetical protein
MIEQADDFTCDFLVILNHQLCGSNLIVFTYRICNTGEFRCVGKILSLNVVTNNTKYTHLGHVYAYAANEN